MIRSQIIADGHFMLENDSLYVLDCAEEANEIEKKTNTAQTHNICTVLTLLPCIWMWKKILHFIPKPFRE